MGVNAERTAVSDLNGVTWRKSSRCADNLCVEVAHLPDGRVALRNSGGGPQLEFTPAEWDAFLGGVKDGEFELP